MLGERISDPDGVESSLGSVRGLGLLPVETRLEGNKTTRIVRARTPSGIEFQAYEIHMGVTVRIRPSPGASRHPLPVGEGLILPFAILEGGAADGVRNSRVIGTYLHGALENKAVLEELLARTLPEVPVHNKDSQYDRLAEWFAEHVNQEIFAKEYL